MSLRSFAYALARFLGDVNAVKRGKIAQRLGNRLIGKHLVRRLWLR